MYYFMDEPNMVKKVLNSFDSGRVKSVGLSVQQWTYYRQSWSEHEEGVRCQSNQIMWNSERKLA